MDGAVDVVAATTAKPFLQVNPAIFLGDGKGNLTFTGNLPGLGVFLATGDVNNDGKPDVVTTYFSSPPKLRAFVGNGFGGFTAQSEVSTVGSGNAGPVVLGFVDGNGSVDAVTRGTDPFNNPVARVLLGDGTGNFVVNDADSFVAPGAPDPAIGDLNGDGLEDLAATSDTTGVFIYRLATAPGVFGPPVVLGIAGAPTFCVLADLDSTGRIDVVLATPNVEWFTVLQNQQSLPPGVFIYGTGTAGA